MMHAYKTYFSHWWKRDKKYIGFKEMRELSNE